MLEGKMKINIDEKGTGKNKSTNEIKINRLILKNP